MRFFTSKTLNALTLAAMAAASMSTAVLAQDAPAKAPAFDFAAMDADKDGSLTKAEIEAHRAAQIAAMDADKDGKITAEELAAAQVARASEMMQARATNRAKHMIVDLDSDGDGALSVAEMTAGGDRSARMFNRIDANSDDVISQEEADAAMEKMAHRGGKEGRGSKGGHDGHGRMGGEMGGGMGGGKGGFGGFW